MISSSSTSRRAWTAAVCLVAVVVLVGCLPMLLGRAAPVWDASAYFAPHFSLVADFVKAGRLELWNPWSNGGTPDFAEPQLGTASPVLLAFAWIWPNPFSGFIAYWTALWIFGGTGMVLLCKHLGAPVWGAVVIAVGFVACGVYTGNAEHTSIICSTSFLPWVFWRFDRALSGGAYRHAAEAGLLWGLSALGGYPGITIATSLLLALWGIGRAACAEDDARTGDRRAMRGRVVRLTGMLAIVGVVGLAVMSPSYVSFLREARGYTYRAEGLDRQFAITSNALPPPAFATIASPFLYLLRRPDQHTIWPEADISMTNVYMGVLVAVLALTALCRPSRWRIWIAGLAVFAGCCAVGSHLPVRGWLYDWVPPTRYFRLPSIFRLDVIFIGAVLAAYGARDLEALWTAPIGRRTRGRAVAVAGAAAILAVAACLYTMRSVHESWSAARPAAVHLLAWPAAVLLVALAGRRLVTRRTWAAGLVLLAVSDGVCTLWISHPTIYDAGALDAWQAMQAGHVSSLDALPGWARAFFPPDALGRSRNDHNVALKTSTLDSRVPLKNAFFTAMLDDPTLNRVALGAERVWFSDRPAWLAPTPASFDAFARASHDRSAPILALHRVSDMTAPTSQFDRRAVVDPQTLRDLPAAIQADVRVLAYTPETLALRYHADRDGWLLVTDRWAPSWTAIVNGRDQPLLGADFVFRAVAVERGDNTVLFICRPAGYFAGVAMSWITMGGIAAWTLGQRRRRRRPR